jgi:hypothetical protein
VELSPPSEAYLLYLKIESLIPKCYTPATPLRFTKNLQFTSTHNKLDRRCVHWVVHRSGWSLEEEHDESYEQDTGKIEKLGERLLIVLRACRDNHLKSFV